MYSPFSPLPPNTHTHTQKHTHTHTQTEPLTPMYSSPLAIWGGRHLGLPAISRILSSRSWLQEMSTSSKGIFLLSRSILMCCCRCFTCTPCNHPTSVTRTSCNHPTSVTRTPCNHPTSVTRTPCNHLMSVTSTSCNHLTSVTRTSCNHLTSVAAHHATT